MEMKPFVLAVLLLCLTAYGHGRPSDAEQHDDVVRDTNRAVHPQRDNVGDVVAHGHGETSATADNALFDRLKSIARLRTADARMPAADTLTGRELEALRELLDRNLMMYRDRDEHSAGKRPDGDPYIGHILHGLNAAERQPDGDHVGAGQETKQPYGRAPVRRKTIRHTVFATPVRGANRLTGDTGPRVDWSSPFADYFPILINDPFQTMINSFSEIVEYGPAADVCRRRDDGPADRSAGSGRSRRSRRDTAAGETDKGVLSHVRPLRPHTTTTTERPKMYHWAPDKQAAEHNGDTGPQIKRLVVRRGGVAIAGPGGIATAGSGGTAIVGPGGSAYSSKDSASAATADVPPPPLASPAVSMAGYGPHVVQAPPDYFAAYHQQQQQQRRDGFGRSADGGTAVLSADGVAYTFPVPSRGLTAAAATPSFARQIVLPDGAKIIATGPIVYYNPEPLPRAAGKKSRKTKKSPSKKRGAAGRKSP